MHLVFPYYFQSYFPISNRFFCNGLLMSGGGYYFWVQVSLAASNRIGKEVVETEHGPSQITFYGNSFIAGITSNKTSFRV